MMESFEGIYPFHIYLLKVNLGGKAMQHWMQTISETLGVKKKKK